MKNILKNVFIFLISLSVLTAFSSCKNKNEDPKQEEFGQAGVDSEQPREELDPLFALGEKLRETGSYQLTTTVNAPLLNLVSVKTLVDGNVQYTPKSFLIEEEYIEVTADAEYSYTKNDSGNWQKRKIRSFAGSQSNEDEDLIKLFDPSNYDKTTASGKTKYKQKADAVFTDYENVEVTLTSKGCKMTMRVISEGQNITMEFEKIGEIELELPTV